MPSEEQLDEQRVRRDAAWQQMRRSWQAGEAADAQQAEAFEAEVRASDEIADRLRREADRVTTRAKLRAELAECEQESAALEREITAIAARRADLQTEWVALWKPAGVDPLAPAEMRTWLVRSAAVVKLVENLEEKGSALASLEERRTRHRAELCEALQDLSEPAGERIASFEGLLEFARDVLEERLARAARSTELSRAIDEANGEIGDLERRYEECGRALETWSRAWEEGVAPLGLLPEADAVEALAVLDELTELFGKMDSIRQLRRRIDGIERDAAQFADLVSSLVQLHASNLSGLATADAADHLLHAYQRAQSDRRERNTTASFRGWIPQVCESAAVSHDPES